LNPNTVTNFKGLHPEQGSEIEVGGEKFAVLANISLYLENLGSSYYGTLMGRHMLSLEHSDDLE